MSADPTRAARRDRITGLILLAFAVVWSVIVYQTIPGGQGEGDVGPRAFPLIFGVLLAGLAGFVVVNSFRKSGNHDGEDVELVTKLQIKLALGIFALIIVYGFLLLKIGFLLATPVIVSAALWGVLGVRNLKTIAGMAVGMTAGCWLIFGKILGAYLPPGTWIYFA